MALNTHPALPAEWEQAPLKEICTKLRAGGTPKRSNTKFWDGDIPFVKINDITSNNGEIFSTKEFITESGLENSSAWIVPEDALLLSMYASIGEPAINRIPLTTNQAIIALLPNEKKATVEFLYYALKNYGKDLIRFNVQSTQKNINKGIVENFEIPLPPLPEQRAIANVLSTVREAIQATEKVIEAARELKRSMMEHLFFYGPVPISDVGTMEMQETEIGHMPTDWDLVKFEEVIHDAQYGLNNRSSEVGSFPVLRMNNIQEGNLDLGNLKYADLSQDQFLKYKVNHNDILFNRTNSYELVGKTAIAEHPTNLLFASYLIRLSLNDKVAHPKFFNYYLNWGHTQHRLRGLATRGVSQSNISASKLKMFEVAIPPIRVQDEIASTLTQLERFIRAQDHRKAILDILFQSMLSQLMTGLRRL